MKYDGNNYNFIVLFCLHSLTEKEQHSFGLILSIYRPFYIGTIEMAIYLMKRGNLLQLCNINSEV